MQANNDQNWAEDGAFWDEAWTDMNRRLDENPPRRKRGVAWWWQAGSLILGLLLVPIIINYAFSDAPETKTELTPVIPATPEDPALHPAAAPEKNAPVRIPASEKEVYADKSVDEKNNTSSTETPAGTRATLKTPSSPPEKLVVPTPRRATTTASENAVSADTSRSEIKPALTAPFFAENLVTESSSRMVPAAIAAIPRNTPEFLPLPAITEFPAVAVGKNRQGFLYLEAGTISTVAPNVSGYYAGVGYRMPLSKRLSVPLSIRYRRESLPVGDYPASGSAEYAVVDPGAFADSTDLTGVQQPAANRLDFTTLKTEAVALTAGVSYAVTPRLRATAGVNVAYMTRALISGSSSSVADPTLGGFENNSFDLFNGSTEEFRNVFDPSFPDRGDGVVPDLTPLQFSGHLGVSYEVTRRLGVTAAGTYLLRQPDRAEVIGLPAARAEVGLRWRLF